MSDSIIGNGKVVVNRSMSLDGFIAGPGDAMDWVFDFVAPDEFPDIAAATGAMLIGRRTYEVGKRGIETASRGKISGEDYGGGWSGPEFVLTHEPPDPPDPEVTFLTGDIGEAVATALDAAGGKNLEILGADVAGQCLRRVSSARSWCTSFRCCSATASASRPRASPGSTWNRSAARSRAPSPSCGSASASSPGLHQVG
jgi:dihydrofolate reductase